MITLFKPWPGWSRNTPDRYIYNLFVKAKIWRGLRLRCVSTCNTFFPILLQWAKIVLVMEQTVTTSERRKQRLDYSQPTAGNSQNRSVVFRWIYSVCLL